MPSFKKHIRNIAQILLLILLLQGTEKIAGEFVTAGSWSLDFKQDIQAISDRSEPVDMIFIGASRTYRTYVPEVFEEKLGMTNVINAGTSAQRSYGTYYILRDLLNKFDPDCVIIGVTWNGLQLTKLQGDLITMDYIPSWQRIPFALEACPENLRFASYVCRFADSPMRYFQNWKDQKNGTLLSKTNSESQYAGNGFVYSTRTCPQGSIQPKEKGQFICEPADAGLYEALEKAAALCEKKGIPYYFASGITSMSTIYAIEDYQKAVDFYSDYAERHNTKYFNLNYLVGREEFLPDTNMHDSNHVNGEGAYWASEVFAEILEKEFAGEDTSHYFYEDLDALKAAVHRIVAADVSVKRDGDTARITAGCLANADMVPEYRVLMSADGGEYQEIIPYTQETEHSVDVSGLSSYAFRVEVRQQGNANFDAFVEGLK